MILDVCRTEKKPSDWFEKGDRTFKTIGSALAWLSNEDAGNDGERETVVIRLSEGVFKENIRIETHHLILTGQGVGKTIITGSLGAAEILDDGLKRGTFRTQTVFLHGNQITLRDLTIENTAGPGKIAGQALALYADGDGLYFENVELLGYQDTLFTGPLPEKEREKGGFRGPMEYEPRVRGRHFYRNCLIAGTVDFIFGGAQAWFENCELRCRKGDEQCYITAASTPQDQRVGYIFNRCRITAEEGAGRCWLGRPWREGAKVVLLNCELEAPIEPEGWHDWSDPTDPDRTFFGEYASRGPGANDTRAAFARIMSGREADLFRYLA